eukprot:NODE_185_length_13590_cov_0.472908.p14 type:complete len:105 gc:universal NODE_185_length_13590_cov_0.472908:10466-10152(-)
MHITSPPVSFSTASNSSITPCLFVLTSITCPGNILPRPKDLRRFVALPLVNVISSSFVAKTRLLGFEIIRMSLRTGSSCGVYFKRTHKCDLIFSVSPFGKIRSA